MVISKTEHARFTKGRKERYPTLAKRTEPIPITEMTSNIADHHRNRMDFIPIEQKILYEILEELKSIHVLLIKR